MASSRVDQRTCCTLSPVLGVASQPATFTGSSLRLRIAVGVHAPGQHPVLLTFSHLGRFLTKDVASTDSRPQERSLPGRM